MRGRLSLLMFLNYAAQGALVPLFSLRLQELGFTPVQIGTACATQALAALVAPLLAGQVADRWVSAGTCLVFCAGCAGSLLWLLARLTTFLPVFATSLAFWAFMGPASTLTNALSFAHLPEPQRDFGRVRLWGTVGWVAASWAVGYWLELPAWVRRWWDASHAELADVFRIAGVLAFLLAAYALTLPHTPPQRDARVRFAPLGAVALLREPGFAVFGLCALGVCITLPFATQVNPLLLQHLGVPKPWLSPTLTLGQTTEIVTLGLLPVMLGRLGLRRTMLVGLGSWALFLCVLTRGEPLWLVVVSLGLNGLCICCFIVAGQVYVNGLAKGSIRTSAQGFLTFLTAVGLLSGNLLVGWVRGLADERFSPTYAVGASVALTMVGVFSVGFRGERGGEGGG